MGDHVGIPGVVLLVFWSFLTSRQVGISGVVLLLLLDSTAHVATIAIGKLGKLLY